MVMTSLTQLYTIHERTECVTLGVNTVTYDVEAQKTGVTETYVVTELVERFGKEIVDLIKLYDDTHDVPFIPGEILQEGKSFFCLFSVFFNIVFIS